MWLSIFFIIAFSAFSSGQNYKYSIRYIDVPVDHFSFTNNATFKLRYLYNETYWKDQGPIFFYTGNEGDIETFAQNTGFMWEIAPEFGALLVFAEHRYYGKSLPFGKDSFSDIKHLGYLTSAQAMADYIFLIGHLQNTTSRSSRLEHPVVAFGGSYGGMLAAWIRQKYPATILGAIASSAPILQFGDLVPCNIFNNICTEVYRLFSHKDTDCSGLIKRSWRAIRKIASTDAGKAWLCNEWKLCKALSTDADTQALIDWLTEIYGNLAMVNYPYPTDFLAPLPGYPVREVCNHLNNMTLQEKDLVRAVFNAVSVYTNYTGKIKCNNVLQATPGLDANMWNFQACSEMVMPMCSTTADMFEEQSWNLTAYSEACYQQWGVRPAPNLVLDEYGGARLLAYTNVVFSNGLLDPWSGGGVIRGKRRTRRHSLVGGTVAWSDNGDAVSSIGVATTDVLRNIRKANTLRMSTGSRATDALGRSTGTKTVAALGDSSALGTTVVPNSGTGVVASVGSSVVPSVGSAESGTTVVPNTLTTVVPNVGETHVVNVAISNVLGVNALKLNSGAATILGKSGESVTASILNSDATIKTGHILGNPIRTGIQGRSTHTDVLWSSADVLESSGGIGTVPILDSSVPIPIDNFNDGGILQVPATHLRGGPISDVQQWLDLPHRPITEIGGHHIPHHDPTQSVSSRNGIYFIKGGHGRDDFFEHFGLKSGTGGGWRAAEIGGADIGTDGPVKMSGSGGRWWRRKREERLVVPTMGRPYVVVLIPGVPHHLDLRATHLADPSSIVHARLVHKSEIKQWLDAYYA